MNKIIFLSLFLFLSIISIGNAATWKLPAGIACWRNITLNNQQSTALVTGTPIILNFSLSPFSSCAKSDLSNYEIFNGFTGNIYYSSIEGNSLNFGSSTSLNSIASGGNLIIVSVIDHQIPATTSDTNGLTIGFKSFSSFTLNTNNICESSQLTSPVSNNVCDANIWSYNQLFSSLSGNSLPTGWVSNGAFSGNIIDNPTNVVLIAPNKVYWGITNTLTSDSKGFSENTVGNVIYALEVPNIASNVFYGTDFPFSLYITNSIGPLLFSGGTALDFGAGCNTPNANLCVNINSITTVSPVIATIPNIQPQPNFLGISLLSSTSHKFSLNFTKIISDTNTIASFGAINSLVLETSNTVNTNPLTIYKIISGIAPPSGIYPQVTVGALQKPVTATSLTLSNTLIDQGQSILFTATTGGGVSANYNYNYSIVTNNPVISIECPAFSSSTGCNANALVGNTNYANRTVFNQFNFGNFYLNVTAGVPTLTLNDQGFGTSNGAIVNQIAGVTANSQTALIWLAGSSPAAGVACPQTAYSLAWNTVLSNQNTRAQFIGVVINTIIAYGANGVFIDIENCASGDITFANLTPFSSQLASNIMANTQIINPIIKYGIYDSLMQTNQGFVLANVINNANQISLINEPDKGSALAFKTYAANAPFSKLLFGLIALNQPGEYTNLNGNIATAINSGMGLEVYSGFWIQANMIAANSIANALNNRYPNANGVLANQLYTGVTSTSNTFFWTPPANLYTGNSLKAIVKVTDTAGDFANSTYQAFGYNSALATPTISTSSTAISAGQSVTISSYQIGGTTAYTYNFIVFNSVTNVVIANQLGTSNSFTPTSNNLWITNSPVKANVIVTDSATTITKANSINTPSITIASTIVQTPTNVYLQNATTNPTATFPTGYICANTLSGYCAGNNIISGTAFLSGNLFVSGNLTVASGAVLTTLGYSILTTGKFTLAGTIYTGAANNNGVSASAFASASAGISYPNSFAGSGGGGSSGQNPGSNGGLPNPPVLTNANIATMYTLNFNNYLTGAGGGGGTCNNGGKQGGNTIVAGGAGGVAGTGSGGQSQPGSGAFGIYIQANTFVGTGGFINANGLTFTGAKVMSECDDGGTGAGGLIIIANGLGTYTAATYNTAGGAIYNYGGLGSAGNVVTYSYGATAPLNAMIANINSGPQFYPYKIYTNTILTAPTGNYSLTQTIGGVTTTLVTNAQTLNYIAPANQASGIYVYNVLEVQGTNALTITVNVTANMLSITNAFTMNLPVIQYFPNSANFSKGSFINPPTNWKLWTYPVSVVPTNSYGINTISGSVFSSNSLTFPVNVQLTYNGFPSFNISFINNPAVQTTITQNAFQFIATNAAAPNIITRVLMTVNVLNQKTLTSLLATTNTQQIQTDTFNNFTIKNVSSFNWNSFNIYMPNSNFQNPSITQTLLTLSTTATGHVLAVNNYCGQTITSSQSRALTVYPVDTVNGTLFTFQISAGFGIPVIGKFIQIMDGVSNSTAIMVQQFLIGQTPFQLPLIQGNEYSFRIVNGTNCNVIFATNYSIPSNPVVITLAGQQVQIIQLPNGSVSCGISWSPVTKYSTATCNGIDKKSLVTKWQVQLYNASSLQGYKVINASNITGSLFTYNYFPLSNSSIYQVKITSFYGKLTSDPSQTFSFNLNNLISSGYNNGTNGFITLLFMLVGLGGGKATQGEGSILHMMSNTCFIEALILFFCFAVGLTTFMGLPTTIILIVFLISIGIISMRAESGLQGGGEAIYTG